VVCGNILKRDRGVLVSPANSFGHMDGGIDLAYLREFGLGLQARLKEAIHANFDGELLVGQAVVVPTGHRRFPAMIAAPTMRLPAAILDRIAVMLAARAAFLVAQREPRAREIGHLLMPGFGTLTGRVEPDVAATMMRLGWEEAEARLSPKFRERDIR